MTKPIMPYVVTLDDDFDAVLRNPDTRGVSSMGHGAWSGYGKFEKPTGVWASRGDGSAASAWSQWLQEVGWDYSIWVD